MALKEERNKIADKKKAEIEERNKEEKRLRALEETKQGEGSETKPGQKDKKENISRASKVSNKLSAPPVNNYQTR